MDIDVQGARQFMRAFPGVGDWSSCCRRRREVLLERLRARQTETPGQLAARLQSALQELRAGRTSTSTWS